MLVKNKDGDIETMRYNQAMEAVRAGTHTIVNVDDEGKPKGENDTSKSEVTDKKTAIKPPPPDAPVKEPAKGEVKK
jgi:hypothetical protein